jgi:hypothetical protein
MKCSFCKVVGRFGVWVRHGIRTDFVCMGCLHQYFGKVGEEVRNAK